MVRSSLTATIGHQLTHLHVALLFTKAPPITGPITEPRPHTKALGLWSAGVIITRIDDLQISHIFRSFFGTRVDRDQGKRSEVHSSSLSGAIRNTNSIILGMLTYPDTTNDTTSNKSL
jgi:hypothetical protein